MLLFTTPWNSLNLSRLFHCSVIKVLCFVVVLGDSLFIISYQVRFVKNFFHFFEKFSFNRFCPICYLKRDNFDSLSCVVLFVKNFFVLFWKSFQNHVVLCQIMSYPAVSLTIIPLVFYSVNHFLILFSLASEQQVTVHR